MGDPEATALLRSAARSDNVYVRRAAGEALAALGNVEGIGVLIESLSFPSIDAFYNYGHNVPNTIALYANFDLPDEERYDRDAWKRWFESASDEIDIEDNASAARELEAIRTATRDAPAAEAIEALEVFLSRHPGHVRGEALLDAAVARDEGR